MTILCFRPEFDFTSQYIIKVDDFFLHYLQKVTIIYCLLVTDRICQKIMLNISVYVLILLECFECNLAC